MSETLEDTAQQIADRGRDALVARLRPAFEEAASAHADVLELSNEQLQEMVQRAADRADGLQWRCTLATVASEELGIGLGDALCHPAVVRAQAIVGAPSYEETLAELEAKRETPGEVVVAPTEPEALAAVEGAVEAPGAVEDESHVSAERDAVRAPARAADPTILRMAAVHLGGIANLARDEGDLELRLSDAGLDIARGAGELLGRLTWHEIHGLDVPAPRGIRRRRRREAQLVVRTWQGQATFHIPALSGEELRQHLKPVLERYQQA